MAIEIVSFPSKHGDFPKLCEISRWYQEVEGTCCPAWQSAPGAGWFFARSWWCRRNRLSPRWGASARECWQVGHQFFTHFLQIQFFLSQFFSSVDLGDLGDLGFSCFSGCNRDIWYFLEHLRNKQYGGLVRTENHLWMIDFPASHVWLMFVVFAFQHAVLLTTINNRWPI